MRWLFIFLFVWVAKMNSSQWQTILETYFSIDELRLLTFRLGVEYENLAGETKRRKALELILELARHGRLPALFAEIQASRPDIPLDEMAQPTFDTKANQNARLGEPPEESALAYIQERLQRRRLALFIGADLPPTITGVPPRQALADELARQEGITPGAPLTAVAQQVMHSGNRFRFTELLRRQLDTSARSPLPFHHQIVFLTQKYGLEILITTAYDDLLETAFRQAQAGLNRIITAADLSFSDAAYPTLIKLYGDWQRVDSLTVTEQDINALHNGRKKTAVIAEVRQVFRRYSLLFIGHDLRDPLVQSLFDEGAGGKFQMPAFALWPGLSAAEAAALKSNRGVTVITADLDAFLARL